MGGAALIAAVNCVWGVEGEWGVFVCICVYSGHCV